MARTSLLLSLALVLVIASVSAHPPKPKKTQKNICPPTLSGIQSFPSLEISNFIEEKAKSAPNSVQFNTLFSICKTYSNQLSAFKVAGVKNAYGVVHAKYAMITKAMFAAEAAVGVEGDLAVKLGKSYTGMAGCFVKLEEKIAEMSAKYKFNANAKISQGDRDKVDECLIKLKDAINVFVKVITECSMKFSSVKQIGIPLVHGGGFIGDFAKNGVGFGSNMIGLSGHSQAEAKVGVQGHAEGRILRDYNFDGPKKRETEGDGEHRSGIYPTQAEAKVGVQGHAEGRILRDYNFDGPKKRETEGDGEHRSGIYPTQAEAKVGVQGHAEGRILRDYNFDGPKKRETEGDGEHRSGIYPTQAEAKVGVQGHARGRGLINFDIPEKGMVRRDDEFTPRVNPGGINPLRN